MIKNYLKGVIGDRINLLMVDGCRLESETMAASHFLAIFPAEKTTKSSNSLMEKDQIA